jgi:hypothetical protein
MTLTDTSLGNRIDEGTSTLTEWQPGESDTHTPREVHSQHGCGRPCHSNSPTRMGLSIPF